MHRDLGRDEIDVVEAREVQKRSKKHVSGTFQKISFGNLFYDPKTGRWGFRPRESELSVQQNHVDFVKMG